MLALWLAQLVLVVRDCVPWFRLETLYGHLRDLLAIPDQLDVFSNVNPMKHPDIDVGRLRNVFSDVIAWLGVEKFGVGQDTSKSAINGNERQDVLHRTKAQMSWGVVELMRKKICLVIVAFSLLTVLLTLVASG